MTRARKTLTLAYFGRTHALLDFLPKDASFLYRAPTHLPAPAPELARHYRQLAPREVDLGFAGRYRPKHSVHQAIASLSSTDSLCLRQQMGRWELLDHKERIVGRLSQAFTPPKEMTCIEARITAIINRRQEDCGPEHLDHVRCEKWEVIIPELVFAPT